jgi:hypothetical protein
MLLFVELEVVHDSSALECGDALPGKVTEGSATFLRRFVDGYEGGMSTCSMIYGMPLLCWREGVIGSIDVEGVELDLR